MYLGQNALKETGQSALPILPGQGTCAVTTTARGTSWSILFVAVEKALGQTEWVVVLNRFEGLGPLVKSSSPVWAGLSS